MGKSGWEQMKEKSKVRNELVTITFEETGERFEVKKKVAIPLAEALRMYVKLNEDPESESSDARKAAQLLHTLSEIN